MGVVESIYLIPERGGAPRPVDSARALAGEGLKGDRHRGRPGSGRNLTLIEAEAVEGLGRERGIVLPAGESRRNVVTRDIDLNALVGRRFAVGAVECVGARLCDPCGHLEAMTEPGVRSGLENRGGLRADIVTGGEIAVGNEVADLGPVDADPSGL